MLCAQTLNTIGLGLDVIGFSVLFCLAYPVVMRRDFVTSDRVGIDGIDDLSARGIERLIDPEGTERRDNRRMISQKWLYIFGGVSVVIGFLLQILALFVP